MKRSASGTIVEIHNKLMFFLFHLLAIMAFCGHACADANPQGELLNGAFGFKFSEHYTDKSYNHLPVHKISARTASPFFKAYYLTTTPISGNIVNIVGLSAPYTQDECKASAETVASILKSKYRRQEPYNEPINLPLFKSYNKGLFFTVDRGFFVHSEKMHSSYKKVEVACIVSLSRSIEQNSECSKIVSPYSDKLLREYGLNYADNAYLNYSYTSSFLQYYYLDKEKYWIASKWGYSPAAARKCFNPKEKDYKLMIRYRSADDERRALAELERKRVLNAHQKNEKKGL